MSETARFLPPPSSEADIDERLTYPSERAVEAAGLLGGDLLLLGAGGKIGPSLARLVKRSFETAGLPYRVFCASRFSTPGVARYLEDAGIETFACDLLDWESLEQLPDVPNVISMAGMKFGASGAPALTWAANCLLAGRVVERFRASRIVVLSSGNVYPFVAPESGGATEETPPDPVGEYAQSCLGRERMFEYGSERYGTPVSIIRLNYATDLRYGVLLDIGEQVARGEPVDVSIGHVNTIWQGDANAFILRAFSTCSSPARILNVTGAETISVREAAQRVAALLELPAPDFRGSESDTALLNNARRCHEEFGPPEISLDTLIEWTAAWIKNGGRTLDKPTQFQRRDGKF